MRFYYKKKDETEWYSLKSPDYKNNDDYVEITEKEWQDHLEEINTKVEGE